MTAAPSRPTARRATAAMTVLALAGGLAACATPAPPPEPEPPPAAPAPAPPPVEHPAAEDDVREQHLARLQLRLLARDAELARLQADLDTVKKQLDDAVLEVVRHKAKTGSLGNRAEAATALSEAELQLRALKRERGVPAADLAAAEKTLALGNQEFRDGNFGGAFYLASSTRSALGVVASRLRGAAPPAGEASREARFATPVKFQLAARASVRESPRADSRVLRVADRGTPIVGVASRDRWVLVEFADKLRGWIVHEQLAAR